MLGLNFTHSNCRKWTPCADISCHYLPGVRIGYPCMALPLPLPPTISVGGSGLPLLPPSAALASHYLSGRLRLPLPPPSAALASHYLSGRLRPPSAASAFRCPCLPLSGRLRPSAASAFRCPCLPTISVGGSGLPLLPPSAALASHYLSGRLRPSAASALPLPLPQAQAFRCFRLPLPLPPTISVGGSGLPLLPPSAALASHYLSGRLRPSAASAFRCPRLPLSQWEARAPSVCWLDTPGMPECGA